MSEILGADEKQNVRIQYVRREALGRLSKWPMADSKYANAFEYLTERGLVKAVVDEAQGPLLQAVENAERFDKDFNRLPGGTADVIIGRIVSEKTIGTLGVDSLGNQLFRPWTKAKTE